MRVFELTLDKAPLIAELMARLVPECWGDYDSTLKMITAPDKIGWYMGENAETPKGFLYIKEYECYSCAEIENYGYDDNGMFAAREKIAVLYDKAEQYALEKGLRIIRTIFGSTNMSCHGKKVTDYIEELSTLKSTSKGYEYMLSRGYKLAGFLPNCYGMNEHGIMILKNLCE